MFAEVQGSYQDWISDGYSDFLLLCVGNDVNRMAGKSAADK